MRITQWKSSKSVGSLSGTIGRASHSLISHTKGARSTREVERQKRLTSLSAVCSQNRQEHIWVFLLEGFIYSCTKLPSPNRIEGIPHKLLACVEMVDEYRGPLWGGICREHSCGFIPWKVQECFHIRSFAVSQYVSNSCLLSRVEAGTATDCTCFCCWGTHVTVPSLQ